MASRSSSSLDRKPESSSRSQNSTSFGVKQNLGSIGGIDIEARAKIDVGDILPKQGVSVDYDAEKNTTAVGLGIGSTRSKLGVAIGAEFGVNEDGSTSIKSISGGINVAGFGIEGKAGADGSGGIGVSAFGVTVDVEKDAQGRVSGGISIKIPGGEIGIGFSPNEGKQVPGDLPTPTPTTPLDPLTFPAGNPKQLCRVVMVSQVTKELLVTRHDGTLITYQKTVSGASARVELRANGVYITWGGLSTHTQKPPFPPIIYTESFDSVSDYFSARSRTGYKSVYASYYTGRGLGSGFMFSGSYGHIQEYAKLLNNEIKEEYLTDGYTYGGQNYTSTLTRQMSRVWMDCLIDSLPLPPPLVTIQLPNYPQTLKPMDCCEKVEEIYKFLGIAKLKKNKFPVSNAFLVPGGSGNDKCIDYYSIAQALFRMLANGLIINPKSKPLGSEWQNANATAWASSMYEMMAEAMSDGNSTQRFEITAAMQLVQIMTVLAETARKTEFIIDSLGHEPEILSEDLPVCFTIHESHKGFGKKEPKKINTSNAKSDEQVEAMLGKMLIPSIVPIAKWKFKPGEISIKEALNG